ncbi:hypothetical protein BGZ97_000665 [Linnemannia gamsii]|uniref:VHS domain-containing protein n=1 Tax=Linnemannia gamsii TaxID=64522 RepID=A0A9P6UK66_9FUNG|nr:hypothetical protein BGZ97_000665 [Linnemannia gamsii]
MRIFTKETNITPQIEVLCAQPTFSTWSSLRLLCASVNSVDDGAKEAAKALRKVLRGELPRHQMNAIIAANPQVKLCLMERLASWARACSSDPSLVIIPNIYHALVHEQVVPFYNPDAPSQYPAIRPMAVDAPTSPRSRSSLPPSRTGSFNGFLPTPTLTAKEILFHVEMAKNNSEMLCETVSFTDPDTVVKDGLGLIMEFYKTCMDLQRDTQMYLSEITSRSSFDEICLSQLLHANDDLVKSINCYNDFMEKLHLKGALKRSISTNTATTATTATASQAPISRGSSISPPPSSQQPTRTSSDEAHFKVLIDSEGAGVGSGYRNTTSELRDSSSSATTVAAASTSRGKTVVLSSSPPASSVSVAPAASEPSFDPFADDSHFVTEPDPDHVAAAIRNGKRPVLNATEEPLTEQERDLINLIKVQSLSEPARMETSTTFSSSSSSAAAAAAAIAAARPGGAATALQVAAPVV